MSNLLDKICALRDLIASKQYNKLKFYKMGILQLKEEIHRQISKKVQDYSYKLDFTAQDLRELAREINQMLNDWQTIMQPDTHIKETMRISENKQLNLVPFQETVIPIMQARTESIQPLIELLNLIEYHAVFLYYTELASKDEFAINYTERVI